MNDLNNLLSELREQVEPILKEGAEYFREAIPTCPSQGLRAIRLIECIDRLDRATAMKVRHHWWKHGGVLKDFLSVRRAVRLLEQREEKRLEEWKDHVLLPGWDAE